MSGTSAPTDHFPPSVAVRPRKYGLMCCHTGAVNRTEFQVVRTRFYGHRTTDDVQRILSNDQPHPVAQLTEEALQTDGAGKRDLYVVVGVFVPDEKAAEAKDTADRHSPKLKTIQDFDQASHDALLTPKTTPMYTVVLPVWPDPAYDDEQSQINTPTRYFVLGNMQNGLCEPLRMAIGANHPNLFYYPEWVRPEVNFDKGPGMTRMEKWLSKVKDYCAEYRADH